VKLICNAVNSLGCATLCASIGIGGNNILRAERNIRRKRISNFDSDIAEISVCFGKVEGEPA
jgi:hypothetical protein